MLDHGTQTLTSAETATQSPRKMTPGILDGIRILDFLQQLSGPYATMFLADRPAKKLGRPA